MDAIPDARLLIGINTKNEDIKRKRRSFIFTFKRLFIKNITNMIEIRAKDRYINSFNEAKDLL
jgi:hypothetical protein